MVVGIDVVYVGGQVLGLLLLARLANQMVLRTLVKCANIRYRLIVPRAENLVVHIMSEACL